MDLVPDQTKGPRNASLLYGCIDVLVLAFRIIPLCHTYPLWLPKTAYNLAYIWCVLIRFIRHSICPGANADIARRKGGIQDVAAMDS